MASRTESAVVNVAGLVQDIILVTFPAASTIFTSTSDHGLSSTLYGDMFLPQVAMAIGASLLGARLAVRITAKGVYLLGLSASLVSMALLLGSVPVKTSQAAAYPLLLIATGFLGAGFGLTVPVLNTFTSVFHPDRVDRAVLVLNALLGLGTVLAPVFVAVFVGLGFWWGLPIVSVTLLVLLLLVSVRLPLRTGARASTIGRWLADRVIYHSLPFVLVASFLLTGALPRNAAVAGIVVFGRAMLGCSALLPLTISFGEEDLTRLSAARYRPA